MRAKTHAGIWFSWFLIGFLCGFIPEFSRARTDERHLKNEQPQLQLAEARDLIGRTFLETSDRNYGTAMQDAGRFFDTIQNAQANVPDQRIAGVLRNLQESRDTIYSGLSKNSPDVLPKIHDLYRQMLANTPQ